MSLQQRLPLPVPLCLLQSKCFRHRLAFLDLCCAAQQHFSSAFVKARRVCPMPGVPHAGCAWALR